MSKISAKAVLETLGEVPQEINLLEVAALLRSVSTKTHEARMEVYAVDEGAALCFTLVPRDEMAPDFIRRRPAGPLN